MNSDNILKATHTHPEPLTVAPAEAARLAGVGRTTLYAALSSGELRSSRIGRRRLIKISVLEAWINSHEITFDSAENEDNV